MTAPKIAVAAGIALLAGFLYIIIIALSKYAGSSINPFVNGMLVIVAMAVLIGAGNLTYGKNSHYAKAQDRVRPAQDAHNRAADEANAARRAAALPEDPGEAAPTPQ